MEALGVALKIFLEWLVGFLPAAILRRKYSENVLANLLDVDLRSTNSIVITKSTAMPEVSIWLRVTNLSPFDVTIENCTAELWLGQPVIRQLAIGHPLTIKARTIVADVRFSQTLAENQMQFATDFFEREDYGKTIALYGMATCRTRIGSFTKQFTFERRGKEVAAALM